MKKIKIIFRDTEIIEFCRVTLDSNEIHDPIFMAKLDKRVIVPGMFTLSKTVNFSADFLKNHANSMKVLFNSLLSSGNLLHSALPPQTTILPRSGFRPSITGTH